MFLCCRRNDSPCVCVFSGFSECSAEVDFSTTNGMDIREKMSHKFGCLDFLLSEDGHVWPLRRDVLAMRRCGWS